MKGGDVERKIVYEIGEQDAGGTVMQFLRGKRYSGQMIGALKWSGDGITCNGRPVKMKARLQVGDRLMVYAHERERSEDILQVELPFPVVYEDEDLVVVSKPAGMPVQPSWYYRDNSLANAAAFYYREQAEQFVYRCVTRLDKDTTGLVLLAKNPISSGILYDLMANREIKRTYYAIARREYERMLQTGEKGIIDLPIGKDMDAANVYKIDRENGKQAVTHYEVLAGTEDYAYVKLHLETGRTHQIRVHMEAMGYPLAGDETYHGSKPDTVTGLHRQALHAGMLEFSHPITGEWMRFEASLPKDMKDGLL
ncbi:MAG: RluA family pseudouridine synthase [Lachnospiraceae bacterium]|nr:RluA family pseudouridine synthase [Lachnospiraceae bacterium]